MPQVSIQCVAPSKNLRHSVRNRANGILKFRRAAAGKFKNLKLLRL
ncbi:hypothetical protein CAMGR0001_0601 [Campylobacter gracilis RM3268]|uniref:Uncharacterized protein n=1 Tax=Campylobacter gracilis RM3268 TaxID=553220 RepID=C8PI05_9BACT|nr:hypothetical protein CAMGR0001_0601 [Campylobacter gracilis RM3268]